MGPLLMWMTSLKESLLEVLSNSETEALQSKDPCKHPKDLSVKPKVKISEPVI
jgi:hypothetical protein